MGTGELVGGRTEPLPLRNAGRADVGGKALGVRLRGKPIPCRHRPREGPGKGV